MRRCKLRRPACRISPPAVISSALRCSCSRCCYSTTSSVSPTSSPSRRKPRGDVAVRVLSRASERPVRLLPGGILLLMIVVLSGCAAPLQSTAWRATLPAELTHAVELAAVPFFPQERYQCGPAALATVLASSGAAVTADELAPQVYLPARQGSLQPE